MRLKLFLAEYRKNWLIASIGLVLFLFGFAVLNVNEGRALKHSRALDGALAEAVTIKDENFHTSEKSENYEGKLIHLTGTLRVQEPIADATYNIMVQSVKLRKIVQMYQWHEDFIESKFAEGDESARNYYYFKDWNSEVVDSRSFHSFGSHQNPRQIPMQSKTFTADRAYIGNFEMGEAAKELFVDWTDVTSDTRPDDTDVKMHDGWYYVRVEDLFDPLVGDVRLKFQFSGLEGSTYTIVGKLIHGKIQPYQSKLKKEIMMIAKGELTMEEIFKVEHKTLRKKTWTLRFFGFTMIFFGVISTESLLKFFANTKLHFLSPNPQHQLKSNLKISAILTISVCVFRQLLHYLGILS